LITNESRHRTGHRWRLSLWSSLRHLQLIKFSDAYLSNGLQIISRAGSTAGNMGLADTR
jgi:hypothetical protein